MGLKDFFIILPRLRGNLKGNCGPKKRRAYLKKTRKKREKLGQKLGKKNILNVLNVLTLPLLQLRNALNQTQNSIKKKKETLRKPVLIMTRKEDYYSKHSDTRFSVS